MGSQSVADPDLPIPIVSVQALVEATDDHAMAVAAAAIRHACETCGFFCVTGHGVSAATQHAALAAIREFFSSDESVKDACQANAASSYRGYTRVGGAHNCRETGAAELKESFTVGACGDGVSPMHAPNQWPDVAGFRDSVEALWTQMMALSHVLAKGLALALDKPADWFAQHMRDPVAQLAAFRYPPANGSGIGCGEHTDCGFLTMVLQNDVPGLEVWGSFACLYGQCVSSHVWTVRVFARLDSACLRTSGQCVSSHV